MNRFILLDTGVAGLLTHPAGSPSSHACVQWIGDLETAGETVVLPEITDYELRREILRRNAAASLMRLTLLHNQMRYEPLTTAIMRQAAAFWAQARAQGRPAAPDPALDADMILAAQAAALQANGRPVVVATTNVRHLISFVDARLWPAIVPGFP